MPLRRAAILATLFLTSAAAKKKSPEEMQTPTQTMAQAVDPPVVVTGITSRLVFHVSPLSTKGLLTQQTRDALKAIVRLNGGVPVVHLRALVAGSGDLRRVPQIVSEVFREKHMPLPSVSVVQIGALPVEGAQIVIEAFSESRKDVNTDGLTFGSGSSPGQALHGAMPLLVTCFVDKLRAMPGVNVVQMQRGPSGAADVCEAVGRGGPVTARKLAFTGTQVSIGSDDKAFQRLDRELGDAADVIAINVYTSTRRQSNGATVITVEGLASSDASLAVDEIAVVK